MDKQALYNIYKMAIVICFIVLVACSNAPATSTFTPTENQDPTPYAGKWYGETVELTQTQLKELGVEEGDYIEEYETTGLVEDIGDIKTDEKGTTFEFQSVSYILAPGLNPNMLSQVVLADRESWQVDVKFLRIGDTRIAIMINAE